MAYSFVTYTGNGATTQYAVPFGYIRKEHLQVSLNGTTTTAFTWVNASTIQMNTAPANGVVVKLLRITPVDNSLVDFTDGSTPVARDFDTANTQNLYTNQELRDIYDATDAQTQQAITTANTALSNSTTAINTANGAVTTANAASASAASAVSTANTASTNASAAVSTANTASTTANNAVTTANAASTAATNAVNTANAANATANTASTNASAAVSTANTALSTANTASTNASAAVSTANTASANASAAVTTANNAVTTANGAVTTANTANSKADQAIAVVGNSVLYELVANVAAIPGSPANNKAVEVYDSTGIESFTPLANKPAGFVGSSGLSVRIIYSSTGSTWNWIQYFPNDPETRYLKFSGGTLTGQLRGDDSASASTPGFAFDGDPDTGIGRLGANELGLITGGVVRLSFDAAGNGTFTNSVTIPAGSTVTGYLTTAAAASTYLTQANAASTYQTQAGMSSYLTTATASSTYAPQASPTFTGALYANASYRGNIVTLAGTGIDCSLGNYFSASINGSVTYTVSNVPSSRSYCFTLELTHTSGTITWFSGVVWSGGTPPTLTTGRVHLFMFHTDNGGTIWRASAIANYLS